MKGVKLQNITHVEAQDLLNEKSIVVLPVGGGCAAHGPHLPMGTDMFVAEWLAQQVTERFPVVCLPTLKYAHYPAFINWKGTVSVESLTFIKVVRDIVISFVRHGVKKFLVINSAPSTTYPLYTVATSMNNEYGVKVAVSLPSGLGFETRREVLRQTRGSNACEMETSMMLYINETLVRMDKTIEEYSQILGGAYNRGITGIYMADEIGTPHGIDGNPALAAKEKGEKVLNAMADDLLTFLEAFDRFQITYY
jgi:creatinine amidohydrolase